MTARVYWFSGTGNSLAAARLLAERLDKAELVPIPRSLNAAAPAGSLPDRVGLVFPVYAFGLPGPVREFLPLLQAAPGAYVFTVATMGGLAGGPHRLARRLLAERGLALAAGWSVVMPGNYPVLKPPPPENRIRPMLSRAEAKLESIARLVKAGRAGVFEDSIWPLSAIGAWGNGHAVRHFGEIGARFTVTADRCTSCGLCARVCPVENIRLENGRPVWERRCVQCMACLQWCPAEAIECGPSTPGRRRYRHPAVTANDLVVRD